MDPRHKPRKKPKNGIIKKQISNYAGYKAIDIAGAKLEARDRAKEQVCDVCGRRCRAWRWVPSTSGKRIRSKASANGHLTAPVLLACDAGPDGCASMLVRAGVDKQAIAVEEQIKRLGLVVVS